MASSHLTARFLTPSSSTFSPRTMPFSSPIIFSRAPCNLSQHRYSAFTNSSKKGPFFFYLCLLCLFFPWVNGLFVVSGVERHDFPAKMLRGSSPIWAGSKICVWSLRFVVYVRCLLKCLWARSLCSAGFMLHEGAANALPLNHVMVSVYQLAFYALLAG